MKTKKNTKLWFRTYKTKGQNNEFPGTHREIGLNTWAVIRSPKQRLPVAPQKGLWSKNRKEWNHALCVTSCCYGIHPILCADSCITKSTKFDEYHLVEISRMRKLPTTKGGNYSNLSGLQFGDLINHNYFWCRFIYIDTDTNWGQFHPTISPVMVSPLNQCRQSTFC